MAGVEEVTATHHVGTARRYLVTGATGFVGRRLCARLLAQGDDVTALVRPTSHTTPLAAAGVRLVEGELTTGEGLQAALEGVECVLHLAATVKSATARGYWRCNAEGTRKLAEALSAQPSPPRLVLCSSLAAAGPSPIGAPRDETRPPAPVSHYGRSKLAGEQAVRALADRLSAVTVRPPIVYGPGDPAFLPSLIPMVRSGVVLKGGLGAKQYSLVHVDDLCAALLAATERGTTMRRGDHSSGVYSVCDGEEHTWHSMCQSLAAALKRRSPLILPAPASGAWAVAATAELVGRIGGFVPALNRDKVRELRCAAWTCSMERARQDLAFAPSLTFEKGLTTLFPVPRTPLR